MKKLFKILAVSAAAVGAYIYLTSPISATSDWPENKVDNVSALNSGPFFMVCGGGGVCQFNCPNCNHLFEGPDGRRGNYGGICPNCGYDIPLLNPGPEE